MIITCELNQAEAIRRGYDAPSSTIKLEINPAELSADQRDTLADHYYAGGMTLSRGLKLTEPTAAAFPAYLDALAAFDAQTAALCRARQWDHELAMEAILGEHPDGEDADIDMQLWAGAIDDTTLEPDQQTCLGEADLVMALNEDAA